VGRDQVYGDAGSDRLFGDGGASDPMVFSGDSMTSSPTSARTDNPDKGYPSASFSIPGANNDLEFRAVAALDQYLGWTIVIAAESAQKLSA